jgi:hypothetical protein
VHALSRCQMILTEAKKRAQREFDSVLAAAGLTVDKVRAYLATRPAMRMATYPVPHRGLAAGTAANLVLHVAELMGRGDRLAVLARESDRKEARSEAAPAVAS